MPGKRGAAMQETLNAVRRKMQLEKTAKLVAAKLNQNPHDYLGMKDLTQSCSQTVGQMNDGQTPSSDDASNDSDTPHFRKSRIVITLVSDSPRTRETDTE